MKKKCLHILPMNKLSGAEKLALILCKNLNKYEPIVVCGGDNLANIFRNEDIRTHIIDFNKNIFEISREIANIVTQQSIKVIHAHDNKASVSAYFSKRLKKLDVKIVSHIHNCYPWLTSNNVNKIIDSILRKRYDYNIACGKLVYDFYEKNTNFINNKNTSIFSNAIDLDYVNIFNDSDKNDILHKYNINKNKKIIGFVGRIEEQKGIIPFINTFRKYKESFKDSIILLVGSGNQQEEVQLMIREYKLESYFKLINYTNNVNEIYNIIDILFLPSLYEGLPMVILEAMSLKKAVVSMNVGSVAELVKDEITGYLVEKGNYDLFISKLINLKNNEKNIELYGEAGFNLVEEKYNIKDYAIELEKLYDKLA